MSNYKKTYLYALDTNGKAIPLQADQFTEALNNINTDHSYIHEGLGFISEINIDTFSGGVSEDYLIKTGNKYNHLKNFSLTSIGASVRLEILRETASNVITVSSSGSASLPGNNLNDNSSKVSQTAITYSGVSFSGGNEGERWVSIQVNGDSTNQFSSTADFQTNPNEELVCKPNAYYILRLTNIDTNNADDVFARMFWYEEGKG